MIFFWQLSSIKDNLSFLPYSLLTVLFVDMHERAKGLLGPVEAVSILQYKVGEKSVSPQQLGDLLVLSVVLPPTNLGGIELDPRLALDEGGRELHDHGLDRVRGGPAL